MIAISLWHTVNAYLGDVMEEDWENDDYENEQYPCDDDDYIDTWSGKYEKWKDN